MSKRSRRIAAKKGWETRRKHQRQRKTAARKRAQARQQEKTRIEKLLGEEFNSLKEARRAFSEETIPFAPPEDADIETAEQYEQYYDQYEGFDFEFEDQGEIDAGVDY